MKIIKLNIPNKIIYVNLELITKIEFISAKGELLLYFIGLDQPTVICNNSYNVLNYILSEIDKISDSHLCNVVEVTLDNDKN